MRTLLIAIVLGFSAVSTTANANSCATNEKTITADGFVTGNSLRYYDEASVALYIMGYIDALFSATIYGMRQVCIKEIHDCLSQKPASQLAAIVKKFLNDNPERWHEAGNSIVYNALLRRCFFPDAK